MNTLSLAFRRLFAWIAASSSFLWLAVVAAYLCTAAGRAVYKNYQAQQRIIALQHQLADEQSEKERLQALLVYYTTDDYKVKELRTDMLLKMPNETVYALPESSGATLSEDATPAPTADTTKPSTLPIWRQWAEYLLHGTR